MVTYDPTVHKPFSKPVRCVVKSLPEHLIDTRTEGYLRIGLGASPEHKYSGNLADSVANASLGQCVIRLYRNTDSQLMYEGRYTRLARKGSKGPDPPCKLTEFAYQMDQPGGDLLAHLEYFKKAVESMQAALERQYYHMCPFLYSPSMDERHGFSKPKRFNMSGVKLPGHLTLLSAQDERLLRIGLDRFSMDFRWLGNSSISPRNALLGERVVRLYRSWTGTLIWEARYRPAVDGNLRLHEFAVEGDKKSYNGSDDLKTILSDYNEILEDCLLKILRAQAAGELDVRTIP